MTRQLSDSVPAYIREIRLALPPTGAGPEGTIAPELTQLGANENPLGPSPLAVEAARQALAASNRYAEDNGPQLRRELARRHNLSIDQIILGAGSTELLYVVARLLLRPEDAGVTSHGSFPLYYIAIRSTGARLIETPLRDYRFDLDAIAQTLSAETKLVFLANPNNPTGTMFTADEFDAFLARVPDHVLIVLDEAYCDYIERPDYSRSIDIVKRRGNLMVLRTFSKVYGLAGLRIGYGLGPSGLVDELNKIRGPFNTSGVAQAAALAALDDREHVRRSIDTNNAGSTQIAGGLQKLGVRCIPSVANFIFAEFGYDTGPLSEELAKRGVIVRPMRALGFPQAIRVSVGTRAENERLLATLADVHASFAGRKSETQTAKH
ncbi:MAG TPA: histidinol-phosphate transaminase [Candidatus Acidoferrales bacterium]|nr:histidinol-phosphate transaminase [Candidatus Acidoferrales bacterium]